jgi:hypothetical protein
MRTPFLVALLLLLVSTAGAERKRDPLTEAETDQLREVRMEPYARLKLFVKFAEARLDSIDQMRIDPKQTAGRGKKIHDLLVDFTAIIDELNSNMDNYAGEPTTADGIKQFRKGLKEVILATDRLTGRLRGLKRAGENDSGASPEADDYKFVLQDSQDAVRSSQDIAKEYSEKIKDSPADKKK